MYHYLLRGINDITSPMGRKSISDMIHLVVILSFALPFDGSMTRDCGMADLWISVGVVV